MRKILFYKTWSGRSPVEQFILSLSGAQGDKVFSALNVIERDENVPPHLFKKLSGTGELWEVRAQHGRDAFRLLGFLDGPQLVVLVSGFAKKTKKVPATEIHLAQERRREYQRRKRHE